MKKIVFVASVLTGLIISSCATNNVASNGLIQKRKHTKGFHLNLPSKVSKNAEAVAQVEVNKLKNQEEVVVSKNNEKLSVVSSEKLDNQRITTLAETESNYLMKDSPNTFVPQKQTEVNEKGASELSTTAVNFFEGRNITDQQAGHSKDQLVQSTENKDNSIFRVELILLLILCIILPPLAVYLFEGSWNDKCWISLILTFLFWLPGIIYAFYVVLV